MLSLCFLDTFFLLCFLYNMLYVFKQYNAPRLCANMLSWSKKKIWKNPKGYWRWEMNDAMTSSARKQLWKLLEYTYIARISPFISNTRSHRTTWNLGLLVTIHTLQSGRRVIPIIWNDELFDLTNKIKCNLNKSSINEIDKRSGSLTFSKTELSQSEREEEHIFHRAIFTNCYYIITHLLNCLFIK